MFKILVILILIVTCQLSQIGTQDCLIPGGCSVQHEFEEEDEECPLDGPFNMEPYLECPGYAVIPPPDVRIYSSNKKVIPLQQCRTCDLKLNNDNTGVFVRCIQCYNIPKGTNAGWGFLTSN
ncbi:unnamed protein product [Psylliodes chrysocephalus]|uniref:Uncharacterized protein n=1 Tax=Psylliodes chrysocephalus TaxID=3402493 RepID=A0A9P0CUB8_9CUCU|nr:unnamed protein product [Psylliodes chrysocephala]